MTREAPIGAVPPSKKICVFDLLWCLLVISLAAGLLLFKGLPPKHLNSADAAMAWCLIGTSALYMGQILRRLLQPAGALSCAIAINQWLDAQPIPWFKLAIWTCIVSMIAAMLVSPVFPSSAHLRLRMWLTFMAFFQIAALLRDVTLIGIVPDEDTWSQPRNAAELKPLTSEHWGET